MRRPAALMTTTNHNDEDEDAPVYELTVSPRASIYSIDLDENDNEEHDSKRASSSTTTSSSHLPQLASFPPPSTPSAPPPSLKLLFALLTRRQLLTLLLPAVLSSLTSGGIAPFMTYVIGRAFDAFARFPLPPLHPSQADKDALVKDVGIAALELVALAVGSFALGSLTSWLWIWVGEVNARVVRGVVYEAVKGKEMVWFDLHLGEEGEAANEAASSEGKEQMGAGGLMAKFTRETDDVRASTSLASGLLLQHLTTTLSALLLAFTRSWSLTLIILSSVPILLIIQSASQRLSHPLLALERTQTGKSATVIERATALISTVKAFNASCFEFTRASASFSLLASSGLSLTRVWAMTSAASQFCMMAMFVQAFWFGAGLVREGKISPGDVMSVFWACLIATSNLQMCVPQGVVLARGVGAMGSLMGVVHSSTTPATQPQPPLASGDSNSMAKYNPTSPTTPTSFALPVLSKSKQTPRTLRKIHPAQCHGELAIHNLTFSYPSLSSHPPSPPVLSDVSLFLPAHEMTFIVGASGSGKSTIAQLLMGLYTVEGGIGSGSILLDSQSLPFLSPSFTSAHIHGITSFSASVILDGRSVFDNVAIGVEGVTKEEVEEACRVAMLQDFVRDLPEGYETILGSCGVGLSGGQKQRLAIARARIRNPSVLILDEATSALDPTSRLLVFEALKTWRRNKTTIVITHDLSQIEAGDFVYVLKGGRVVEQGYRCDLEVAPVEEEGAGGGEFRKMMEVQIEMGGFLPEKTVVDGESPTADVLERVLQEEEEREEEERDEREEAVMRHQSLAAIRPLTFGNWMFDVVADLTGGKGIAVSSSAAASGPPPAYNNNRISRWTSTPTPEPRKRRPSSISIVVPPPAAAAADICVPENAYTLASRRLSLQFTPTTPSFPMHEEEEEDKEERAFESGKRAMQRSAESARLGREGRVRNRWDGEKMSVGVAASASEEKKVDEDDDAPPAFWALMRQIWPTIPSKPLLILGLVACIASGAMTPIFSFLLSRLLFEVSTGAQNTALINAFGGIVLGIAALDGLLMGLKYFLMESAGMNWVTSLRNAAFAKVMRQDRRWFDRSKCAPSRLVQVLVKDGDDARNLVAVVWGQACVVMAMLGVGLVWALVRGWQLTLVGFAIAPVFAVTMAVQTRLVAKCEVRNKRAREEVARGYYETISNIRGIRSMGFDSIFSAQFNAAADKALSTGVRGAFVEGCTYGVASGLIYLAEALLFYVGAVLIARGTYSYLQMVEVLNLVVFSVTIGSQLMAFTEKIAKSVQATHDLNKLMQLDTHTDESHGDLCPPLIGAIDFNGVRFSYPERREAQVLKNVNIHMEEGECVAIVGASGSGKSTIAALMQRLYEPDSGSVTIGENDIHSMDVHYLREHVSVVSQHPNLFDATIAENIRYGNKNVSEVDIRRAAKAANAHEFIMSLPLGYDTMIGENAALISSGQAQRLQIARALARPSKILILDECTSALDPENQQAVLEAICKAKVGRTTMMITHKRQVMLMCDRIIVVNEGEVVEQGSYDELIQRKGVFATLASGGEWVSE